VSQKHRHSSDAGLESPRSQRAQETPGSKLVLLPWETAEAEPRSKGTQKPGWPSALDCGFATNLPHTPQNSMLPPPGSAGAQANPVIFPVSERACVRDTDHTEPSRSSGGRSAERTCVREGRTPQTRA